MTDEERIEILKVAMWLDKKGVTYPDNGELVKRLIAICCGK